MYVVIRAIKIPIDNEKEKTKIHKYNVNPFCFSNRILVRVLL